MSAEEALQNLLKTLVRAALQAAILGEGPLASLFGMGKGGGGSKAMAGGGGKGKAGGILAGLLGFADGGFTGAGPKHQPKGIVHAGEIVWSQADIRRAGGRHIVESMRVGARGYASGGVVGAPPMIRKPEVSAGGFQQNQAFEINAPITINGSAGTPEQNNDLAKKMAREMEVTMRSVVADEVRKQSRPGNALNRRGG